MKNNMNHFIFFNLNKSSRINSRNSMQQLMQRVMAILVLACVCAGAWAARNAKVTTSVTPAGSGNAYISTSNTIGTATEATQQGDNGSVTTFTFYVKAVPAPGYTFVKWEFVNASGNTSIDSPTSAETTITAQTASSNGGTRTNVIQAVFKEVEGYVGHVFYSGGDNGNYLNNSTSGTTSFDPKTCIWTGTSGGKFTNGSYYLRNNNTVINQDNASNCTIEGSENGTTGARISLGSGYNLRYYNGWTRSNSTSASGRNVAFAVIKQSGSEVSTAPTISGDDSFASKGNKTYTRSDAAYTMGYNDYIFYNGAHHYWKSDDSEAITGNTKPMPETFTYTWSLSANAAGHAIVEASTGKVTYTDYFNDDTNVTLTLTATSPNKTFTAYKTIKLESPKTDPTGITATIDKSTIYVGNTGQMSYTLQGTPCYDNVTFSSSNTSVVTVDEHTGVVTAVGTGIATITAIAHPYTTGGTDKTATVSVTVKNKAATPAISFVPTSTDGGETATATITCATEGATISYSTDGGTTWTSYPTAGFTVNNLDVVKAKAVKSGDYWDDSDVATATYSKHKVATPTITINNGMVSFSCDEEGDVTYYYTTDGSTPTTSSTQYTGSFTPSLDECTIKVIATMTGAQNSDVAERLYLVQSGVKGNTVILNDYEDHTWTYYAGVNDSVDGGHYNTAYLGKLYSPDPRNVKITYNGVNNVTGSATVVKVSTKTGEGQNSFVYYKTLEQGSTSGEYPYQVISNPFSVRPSTGTTNKTYYGFAGWKIKTGGEYIKGHNNNEVLDLDEEIIFENLPYPSVNCTSAEIVFETTWTQATVKRGGGNVSSNDFSGGTYETNFCVINANSNALSPTYPVTITGVEPDGSTTYTNTITGAVTPANNTATGNGSYMTKLEYVSWNPSGNIDARGRNLTIGRGVTTTGTARELYGTNQAAGASNIIDQVLKVESGTYSYFRHFTSSGTNRIRKQIVVFGCDYDRAKGDNDKLLITGQLIGATGGGAGNASGTHDANLFTNKSYMKSGTFMTGVTIAGAEWDHSYYIGINGASGATGKRLFEMEGGYLANNIAGGMDISINGTKNSDQYINVYIRIRGGHVLGSIYGGARFAESQGSRQIVLTGGEVNGWIAGGANGNETTQGGTEGASYIYVGGNAKVDSKGDGTSIGSSIGGCVYGAGCGYGPSSSSGEMGLGTNVVVADNAYVERGVYGGGAFGYCAEDQTANIYITGGHVEGKSGNYKDRAGTTTNGIIGGVFGGSRMRYGGWANIYMTGGQVDTGVYGGSNYTGTLEHDVKMVITGGQVGKDASHTGNIHGGGYGQPTVVRGDVDIKLGADGAPLGADGVVVYGDVYGGSAEGKVNTSTSNHTNVTLNAGTVNGNIFGGGLGVKGGAAADVNGNVAVTVNGGSLNIGGVFGCNNQNGTPKGTVRVTVNHTNPSEYDASGNVSKYAINAVYGGGNQIAYSGKPVVHIVNCDCSIKEVYGGGNAADVGKDASAATSPHTDATDVTIDGGEIDYAFGGGNGSGTGNPGANVKGNANLKIGGGTINNIFGGSNTLGDVYGNANVTLEDINPDCPITVDEVYGGANRAPMAGKPVLTINCIKNKLSNVYGGSKAVDVNSDIVLNINSGQYGKVFGGNNESGAVKGSITVNIDETGCHPIIIDELYAGGNMAAYTTPAGKSEPTVNVISCTHIGQVFGGGYGKTAVITGDPIVNINQIPGIYDPEDKDASDGYSSNTNGKLGTIGTVFGGGNAANVVGNTHVNIGTLENNAHLTTPTNTTKVGANITGNVYGGGNAADVTGRTNVTVGRQKN